MFVVILTTLCNARPTTACGHAGTRVSDLTVLGFQEAVMEFTKNPLVYVVCKHLVVGAGLGVVLRRTFQGNDVAHRGLVEIEAERPGCRV